MQLAVSDKSVIAFDLDDTLYKEIDFVRSAYKYICNSVIASDDFSLAMEQMWSDFHGREDVFLRLKNRFGVACSVMDLVTMYREHPPTIHLSDGAQELLAQLRQSGCGLAIITDGRKSTQMNKLRALAIDHFFTPIVISESFGSEKPDVRNYKCVEDAYPGHTMVYIGDNFRKDFITPNRRDWVTIGLVDDGRNIHSQAIEISYENRPLHLVRSLRDIVINGGLRP